MALSVRRRLQLSGRNALDKSLGVVAAGALGSIRLFDRVRTSNVFAAVLRTVGPMLREHRIGRANLVAAFPEKSPEEIEQILRGVWAVSYTHLTLPTKA